MLGVSTPSSAKVYQKMQTLRVFGNAATSSEPGILLFCENRHPALSFAQSKSFYSTYFKFWLFLEQLFGFTEPKFCVDRSKITVGVHDMMGSIFWGVTLYESPLY